MTTLNRAAAEVLAGFEVHALTDVTGFGLLGHLRNVTAASGVTARGLGGRACRCWRRRGSTCTAGIAPGGTHANWKFLADWVAYDPALPKEEQLLLCDAQTSGGLLAAVPEGIADEVLAGLRAAGVTAAAIVGRIEEEGGGRIAVSAERVR